MLVAMVAQPPVMEDKLERINQERVDPETVYFWLQISPAPPAFWVIAITTPTHVIITTTPLKMKNHFNL